MTYELPKEETNRLFYDGILYIICNSKEFPPEPMPFSGVEILLDAEHDEPISLGQIRKEYPDVHFVIFNDMFEGEIWEFDKYKDSGWSKEGTTKGFA